MARGQSLDAFNICANGPAIKLVGVAERMEVVTTNVSLGQVRVTQPK